MDSRLLSAGMTYFGLCGNDKNEIAAARLRPRNDPPSHKISAYAKASADASAGKADLDSRLLSAGMTKIYFRFHSS